MVQHLCWALESNPLHSFRLKKPKWGRDKGILELCTFCSRNKMSQLKYTEKVELSFKGSIRPRGLSDKTEVGVRVLGRENSKDEDRLELRCY